MSKRAYYHALAVLVCSTNGAFLILRGTYYTNGVNWYIGIGIYLAGFAAAAFTSAVTTADKRS